MQSSNISILKSVPVGEQNMLHVENITYTILLNTLRSTLFRNIMHLYTYSQMKILVNKMSFCHIHIHHISIICHTRKSNSQKSRNCSPDWNGTKTFRFLKYPMNIKFVILEIHFDTSMNKYEIFGVCVDFCCFLSDSVKFLNT